MKKPVFTFGGIFILIVLVALFKTCLSPSTQAISAKKESPFIDSLYETNWQEGTQASDFDSIASHLSQHNIPCGEIYVKESNSASGSYLCACRTDVTDNWSFYQVWSNESDVLSVQSYKVSKIPHVK